MKIAIIGGGISGMAAGYKLADEHEVSLFEAAPVLGGHTATKHFQHEGERLAVDTGFIVYNDRTYPEFIKILDELEVESLPTRMSFSVSDPDSGLEYAGSNLNTLFAQRRNLMSPGFLLMLTEILRFNREAKLLLGHNSPELTLGLEEFLKLNHYSARFRDLYLVPMGAAIWSACPENILAYPLGFFIRFFSNHGLLDIRNRPQWRVIKGGSSNYIEPLTRKFSDRIHLNSVVNSIESIKGASTVHQIRVNTRAGTELFDHVIFACHSDQALKLLCAPTQIQQDILGKIPYSRNEVVLHNDASLLPRNRRCWSSWNVMLDPGGRGAPQLTYNMNILQGIKSNNTWCVSLNMGGRIKQENIIGVYEYQHPVFTREGILAQRRWGEINGTDNLWFCGAYWRNGFHEDGVWSALRVAKGITAMSRRGYNNAA